MALLLPNVDHIVNADIPSMSRAGRNEAAHKTLTRKAAEQIEHEKAIKRAQEIKKRKEQLSGNDFFEASDFGRGCVDDVKREEMCSSPRLHPQREVLKQKEYRGERMGVFRELHVEIPKLQLVDIGGVTNEAKAQLIEGKTPRDVDDLTDDEGESDGAGSEPASPARVVVPQKPKGTASPHRSRKQPHVSAAFLSPSRWKEASTARAPAVGHYRPKFAAVEYRTTHGTILPAQASTARAKPDYRAPLRLSPTSDTTKELTRKVSGGDITVPGREEDTLPAIKRTAPPAPDKHSTSSFKSKTARVAALATAAPDQIYWPRNDNATSTGGQPAKGQVRFDRMVERRPLEITTAAPDNFYVFKSALSQHSPVKMSKQSPRKPLSLEGVEDEGTRYYDAGRAKELKFPRMSSGPSFDKTSPRKDASVIANTVSVEAVEGDITAAVFRQPKVPSLDRMAARPQQRPAVNDVMYDVSTELTTSRTRAAIVREGGPGHQPLFEKKITENCSYDPDPTPVRPKYLRSIEFKKDVPRPERDLTVRMADLVYDTDLTLTKSRTIGNPMLSQHLSRQKRNALLSPRTYAPDVVYDTSANGLGIRKERGDKGAIDFAKAVPRDAVFKGRGMPSERFLAKHPRAPSPGRYDVK